MAGLTLTRLVQLMEECAERDSTADLDLSGGIENTTFDELGFDSLALFNTCERIEQDFPVRLSLDAVLEASTPGELVALVNASLESAA